MYEGVAEGLKGIYKKKLLPLERESRSPSDDDDDNDDDNDDIDDAGSMRSSLRCWRIPTLTGSRW